MQALRCFVAVPLSEAVRAALAGLQRVLRGRVPDGFRWDRQENLHITLKFLGDVPVADLPAVFGAASRAAARAEATELAVVGVGAFPRPSRPRVLIAQLSDPGGCVSALTRALEDELSELGFARDDRAFHPHVTLARAKGPNRPPDLSDELAEVDTSSVPEVVVEELAVYQSDLRPSGAVYTVLSAEALAYRDTGAAAQREGNRTSETECRIHNADVGGGR